MPIVYLLVLFGEVGKLGKNTATIKKNKIELFAKNFYFFQFFFEKKFFSKTSQITSTSMSETGKAVYKGGCAFMFLCIAVAALIVSTENPDVECGHDGTPPLRTWLFGTGIAAAITSFCFSIFVVFAIFTGVGAIPVFLVYLFAPLFWFIWTIMGSVTLWRDGGDCQDLDHGVWVCSMVIVIYLLADIAAACCCGTRTAREEIPV